MSTTWIRRLFGPKANNRRGSSKRPKRNRAPLWLERLEDRLAPATLITLANGIGGSAGGLVEDSHGNLFGTNNGGVFGYGTVFEVANGSNTVTTLASFDRANGNAPTGDLVLDRDGDL